MAVVQVASCWLFRRLPREIHVKRARDLSATLSSSATMDSNAFASTATLVKGKGKGRAKDDEFFPTVTYRHLLAPVMGVRNPLRVVALWP